MNNTENLPLVYVLILNWNGREHTVKCVDSVLQSSYKNMKILIVDNGSEDGSINLFIEKYSGTPQVELLENGTNLGYAEGNNKGFEKIIKTEAKYLFILNNDTTIEPTTISLLADAAEHSPNAAILAPKVLFMDEKERLYSSFDKISLWAFSAFPTSAGRVDNGQYDHLEELDAAVGCALFILIDAVKKTGLFDPDYFAYYEEIDLAFRLRKANYSIRFVPNAIVYHKGAASTEGISSFAVYLKARNMILFMRKNGRMYHFITFLPIAILVMSYRFFSYALKGNIKSAMAIIKGICWHFTH